MEYWELIENPSDKVYLELIKVLFDNSDKFFFVTRNYNNIDNIELFEKIKPYIVDIYKTNKWGSTVTHGKKATVYEIKTNKAIRQMIQQSASSLYDWVEANNLPEDLTFIKNNFVWFASVAHEELGFFRFANEHQKQCISQINGIEIKESPHRFDLSIRK